MEILTKDFIIKRKDLETNDKKIVHKYSKIIKNHGFIDIRLNKEYDLIKINNRSINKIFDFLEEEIPEEHILFLFEKEYKEDKIKQKKEYIISRDKKIENEKNEENEEKKEFLTLEIENPVLKKFKTVTHQIMKKYYYIFFIFCFIIAILFTIHLLSYLISKELNIDFIKSLQAKYFKYIISNLCLIILYTFLGYYYFTKYKTDKPSYFTIRKLQIFCLVLTIINYMLIVIKYFSSEELMEYYKNHYFYINLIYILSLLCSSGILGFYFMVKKKRGNFSKYYEVLIQ